ncbi:MAG TPA: RNA ligase family protein [Bdellovibrionota bacterium]|nr:RNA ligase family protein [Bdellovibrionota bacterium]
MPSRYIRAPHPKTEISPTPVAIQKVLALGWVAQLKIHGHRVQLHIPPGDGEILAYNRQGQLHKKLLPDSMISEIRRVLSPTDGWNVVEGEWLKPKDRIYFFDFLKQEGESLERLSFQERWKKLPRSYLSPHLQTLPLITSLDKCLDVFSKDDEEIEGLVFKSPRPGFADTTIVRCRKK